MKARIQQQTPPALPRTPCSPSFWMLTTWWNTHKDERGTQWPAGYDTVFTDKHPADWLRETRAKYGSVMHVVSVIEISEAQFLENAKVVAPATLEPESENDVVAG